MKAIHQLVAGFSRGDAISNEAIVMRDIFRSWGYSSNIYSETRRILPELRHECLDAVTARADFRPDDVLLLHLSIGSDINDIFAGLPGRKAILYHNITPAEHFRGIQESIAHLLARGRDQARRLSNAATVVMADSRYNADELAGWGYSHPQVLPLVLDLKRLRDKTDRGMTRALDDGLVNVLFVGRCAPNKRIEDALAAFHYFQRYVEPASRFIHAGSYAGLESYHAYLVTLAREWRLENVIFTGSIRQAELNACYRSSHLFLCMSEHEGFGIPLIESMVHDLPVLAYATAAVPETMDGAGVLFHGKEMDQIAEMMGKLVHDAPLRGAILGGQRERIQRYEGRDLAAELRTYLAPLL